VWAHLLGRGIVEPIDDFRDSNPPSNPELLDALATAFVHSGYCIKPLIRVIMNSRTYQLSAEPPTNASPFGADPERYFTSAEVKILTAEQILDAISSATGIPERFPGYPPGTRPSRSPKERSPISSFGRSPSPFATTPATARGRPSRHSIK